MKLLSLPGKAMQKLTTKEPDDDMIEVAIAAVEAVFDWKAFLGYPDKEEQDVEIPDLDSDTEAVEVPSQDSTLVWQCRGDGRLTLRELLAEGEHVLQTAGIEDWKMDAWYLAGRNISK